MVRRAMGFRLCALALLAVLAGCGAPDRELVVSPALDAQGEDAIAVESAHFATDSDGWTTLWLSDAPGLCDLAADRSLPPSSKLVKIYVGPAAIAPGTIEVLPPEQIVYDARPVGVALYSELDAACERAGGATASGGEIDVVAVSAAELVASFELDFDGRTVAGQIAFTECAALRDFGTSGAACGE
jgi:hypothetical protein